MRGRVLAGIATIAVGWSSGALVGAGQQGIGQSPSALPLTPTIRERGTGVTPAFEGWYYAKDGSMNLLVGYFNRNTKQELDIPVGPNNRIEPGGPDQGQPTHFMTGRQWGVFSIKLPKDFGTKKLTWTIVANGLTNAITLHTQADYVVEPYEDAASKNTPPKLKFSAGGPVFTGAPSGIAEKYTATVGAPLTLTVWATDEGAKVNVPEGRGRGGRGAARGTPPAAGDAAAAAGAAGAQGRGRGRAAAGGGAAAGDPAAAGAPPEFAFTPPPPIAITWSMFRGPAAVKFDNPKPKVAVDDAGKTTTTATFTAPGEYILRVQGNDSTGEGGGGFQCCWTNAHVAVSVK
jgi:hypothetical protein